MGETMTHEVDWLSAMPLNFTTSSLPIQLKENQAPLQHNSITINTPRVTSHKDNLSLGTRPSLFIDFFSLKKCFIGGHLGGSLG